jgi:hypothetical protein
MIFKEFKVDGLAFKVEYCFTLTEVSLFGETDILRVAVGEITRVQIQVKGETIEIIFNRYWKTPHSSVGDRYFKVKVGDKDVPFIHIQNYGSIHGDFIHKFYNPAKEYFTKNFRFEIRQERKKNG